MTSQLVLAKASVASIDCVSIDTFSKKLKKCIDNRKWIHYNMQHEQRY